MSGVLSSHTITMAVGWLLGTAWFYRLVENIAGMRHVDELFGPQFEVKHDESLPSLRVVIPARNEEQDIEKCLRSLLAVDYPALEIIAIDDRSTDATGAIMDRVAQSAGEKLRVIHVTDLPPGWLGKTHAMWLGAKLPAAKQGSARGDAANLSEWILFTDGDIFFRSDSLRRAVAYAQRQRTDHVGMVPSFILSGFGERMILSFLIVGSVLAMRPWRVADPHARDFVGIGAFNLIRRGAYEKLGTYEALRLEVLDDLKLGETVKRAGFSQRMPYGRGLVKVQWGRGAFGILGNLTKNLFAVVRFRLWRAIAVLCGLLFLVLGPLIGLFAAAGLAKIGYALAVASIIGLYINMGRFDEISPVYAATYPLSCLLIAFAIVRSTLLAMVRGGIVWRGTKYPLSELRRSA